MSSDTLRSTEKEIKNIIAHEVLHTCFLSMDHGYPWEMYKNWMNNKLGYNIDKKQIENQLINTLGMHIVKINLYKDIDCNLKVHTEG